MPHINRNLTVKSYSHRIQETYGYSDAQLADAFALGCTVTEELIRENRKHGRVVNDPAAIVLYADDCIARTLGCALRDVPALMGRFDDPDDDS